jgi:thymidylate synthase
MNDISSRRAVIQLYEPDQNFLGSPDVSCAMSLQFVCRGGSLDLTVNMRSNDAYFGFPYDVFLYTNLQELMATELGVSVGRYCHFASSFHLYENDLEKARRVVSSSVDTIFVDLPLKLPAERAKFCAAESSVRLGDAGHNSIRLDDDFWHEKYLYLLEMHGGQPTRNVYADAFSH